MTASDPLISFVVPCYNYGRFLPDCLNSIFRQEGDYNFEIIAIDDCSTDNTLQILEAISDPRLKRSIHSSSRERRKRQRLPSLKAGMNASDAYL